MALTNRQTFAMNERSSAPGSFVHEPAANKPVASDGSFAFTADAATYLLTTTAHGLVADDRLRLTTTGTLPGGFSLATDYYVLASGLTPNDFKVSITAGGSAVNITSAGTGTHSWQRYLTAEEQAAVDRYLDFIQSGGFLPAPAVQPQAVSLIAAHHAHLDSPAYRTWWNDDQFSREAQYKLRKADMFAANDTTVPPSADDTGSGSGPPSSPVPRDPL